MVDVIACGCVACAWAVVADKGTKKRKETHKCGWWTQLRADALRVCGLWMWRDSGGHGQMRVNIKERKKLKLTGCTWLMRLCACVCGLWTRMRGTKREKEKNN